MAKDLEDKIINHLMKKMSTINGTHINFYLVTEKFGCYNKHVFEALEKAYYWKIFKHDIDKKSCPYLTDLGYHIKQNGGWSEYLKNHPDFFLLNNPIKTNEIPQPSTKEKVLKFLHIADRVSNNTLIAGILLILLAGVLAYWGFIVK